MQSRLEQPASNTQLAPILDESTFQKILHAVYVLQQESEFQRKIHTQDVGPRCSEKQRELANSNEVGNSAPEWLCPPEFTWAEPEWRHRLAAERASMLAVLERIKPQLERLARASSA
jgi:hypothetical protein